MLIRLPPELLCHVYSLLPSTTVNQVSLTCHSLYISALPSLYSTIVLSFRKHIRQLEIGLQRKEGFLHHVMRHYTKEVLLKCKQGGQHRLTFDIRPLLRQLPHIRILTLVDFHMLPINFITPLLLLLPHLEQVSLRYCDLIAVSPSLSATSLNLITNNNSNNSLSTSSLTTLELFWTDFPKEAMDALLSALPYLTKVRLLANHNRHYMANNHALVALQRNCQHVKDLEVGLQEVDERTVVNCIKFYGKQVQRLSVRCHSPLILDTITNYTPFLRNLIVRFSLDTLWYASSSMVLTTQDTPPSSSTTTTAPRAHHQGYQSIDEESQEANDSGLLHLILHCQHLEHIQILSMSSTVNPASPTYDPLPPIVSKALVSVVQKRFLRRTTPSPLITTISTTKNNGRQSSSTSDNSSGSNSSSSSSSSNSSGSDNHHRSREIAPEKKIMTTTPMNNDNDSNDMISLATFTTQLNMKATPTTNHHNLREQRKWNVDMIQGNGDNNHPGNIGGDNETMMTERTSQQRRSNTTTTTHLRLQPLAVNINGTTQMYTFGFQQQSAKEHTRMESSLTLDNEQLGEIRWLASIM